MVQGQGHHRSYFFVCIHQDLSQPRAERFKHLLLTNVTGKTHGNMFICLLLHDISRSVPGKPHALQEVVIAPYDTHSFVRVRRSTHDTGLGSSLIGKGTPVFCEVSCEYLRFFSFCLSLSFSKSRETNAKTVISANSKFLHTSPPSSSMSGVGATIGWPVVVCVCVVNFDDRANGSRRSSRKHDSA